MMDVLRSWVLRHVTDVNLVIRQGYPDNIVAFVSRVDWMNITCDLRGLRYV